MAKKGMPEEACVCLAIRDDRIREIMLEHAIGGLRRAIAREENRSVREEMVRFEKMLVDESARK
jgi:hypothetical protein